MEERSDAGTTVSIEVRRFDDATQRDACAATTVELYGAMGDLACDLGGVGGDSSTDSGTVSDMLVADVNEIDRYFAVDAELAQLSAAGLA